MTEDPFARMHREYRDHCILHGTYRPATDEEIGRAIERWKAECKRDPEKKKRAKKKTRDNSQPTLPSEDQ